MQFAVAVRCLQFPGLFRITETDWRLEIDGGRVKPATEMVRDRTEKMA